VTGTTITTIAGTTCGYSGDGGPATSAQLANPSGLAVDGADLYIADYANCRVRKVSGGTITTVAGFGFCDYSGDAGPATSAGINAPSGVALDADGNLYIADTGNCRVREVSGGIITTVAGGGGCGFSGDGGPATSAALNVPTSVALDGQGNLYIADIYNCRVRAVIGGTITTIAGVGTGTYPDGCEYSGDGAPAAEAALHNPNGVAVDARGNVYIADSQNCRVRRVSGSVITTVAGDGTCGFGGDGGPATAAQTMPFAVALDAAGNLFIADAPNARVREVFAAPAPAVGGVAEAPPLVATAPRSGNDAVRFLAALAIAVIGGGALAVVLRRRVAR
jgi:sugar lactone lactonase YvrE